ncbi:hypothetical protein BJH93_01000 [Kocuria polaris]|nr:hypothetical protein [Kocuria polaris]
MKHTPAAASRFDPYSPLSGAVQAVVTGALTLIDPAAFSPNTRRVARGALSAGTGLLVGLAWKHGMRKGFGELPAPEAPEPGRAAEPAQEEENRLVGTRMAVGLGGAMTVLTYGWLLAGEKIDAGIHHALARRGARHPRVIMALGAAGLSWVLFEVDRRTHDQDADGVLLAAGDEAAS